MITFSESQILIQHNLLDPLRPIHPMDIHEMRLLRLAAHAIALLNLYEKIENSSADNIAIIVGSYGSAKQQCPQLFINSNPNTTTDIFNIDPHFDKQFAKEQNLSTQNTNVFTIRTTLPGSPNMTEFIMRHYQSSDLKIYNCLPEKTLQLEKRTWEAFSKVCQTTLNRKKKLALFQFTSPFPLPLLDDVTKSHKHLLQNTLAYIIGYSSSFPVISCHAQDVSSLSPKKPFAENIWHAAAKSLPAPTNPVSGIVAPGIDLLQFKNCFHDKNPTKPSESGLFAHTATPCAISQADQMLPTQLPKESSEKYEQIDETLNHILDEIISQLPTTGAQP